VFAAAGGNGVGFMYDSTNDATLLAKCTVVVQDSTGVSVTLTSVVGGGAGRNRTSTVSSMSTTSLAIVDWTGALPLRNESDWATAIASCGSKITLRMTYPTPPL